MHFTENKELQRFERDMKVVPNFERKEVWEFADSCSECSNCDCKLDSCVEAHCPYIKRKIQSTQSSQGIWLKRSCSTTGISLSRIV